MPQSSRIRLAFLIIATVIGLVIAARYVSASPTPTPFDASTIDYSQFTPEEIAKTEAHRDQLKDQHRQELEHVGEVANAQGATLNEVQVALSQAKSSFITYQTATEAQIERGNKAIAALAHVLHQLHLAKLIATGLVLAVAGMIALKLPPPIGLYAAGAFAVAGTSAVWLFL